jgi:hypothetical protein
MIGCVQLQYSTTVDSLENWSSALIRRMCHSPFSHVDMILPDGNLLGASDSVGAPIIKGNPRGVAVRPPDYQDFGIRRRMTIQTPLSGKIIDAGMSQLGKPFDHAALQEFLSDKFPGLRNWRDPAAWFCAELCTWSFETGGYWFPSTLAWPKNLVSPTDQLLLFMMDANWADRDIFWDPVPGLKLGAGEH